ncbi:MAG: hypothetical protein PHQ75_03045 [Thermoguttaceae bacterium]|nr:hypothetical protein [Thermoguttaceae bacterium]
MGKNQRQVLVCIFVFLCFWGLIQALWLTLGKQIDNSTDSRIRLEDIHVLEPPQWVESRFVQEALATHPDLNSLKDGADGTSFLSIHTPDLVKKLTVAFEGHPWTQSVESIRLEYPAKVTVKIIFRRPVAVVAVPKELYPEFNGGGFPIDANGVLLPVGYFQEHDTLLYNYPWIEGITSAPMRSYGEPWNDPLVIEAAMLADYLRDIIQPMSIRRIRVREKPNKEPGGLYDLETIQGTRIYWGEFPLSGNLQAKNLDSTPDRFNKIKDAVLRSQENKKSRMRWLVTEYKSLDAVPGDMKPIDLSRH